jgi:hypothetical protein
MLMTRERGTMKWTLRGEEELGSFFCNSFFFFLGIQPSIYHYSAMRLF